MYHDLAWPLECMVQMRFENERDDIVQQCCLVLAPCMAGLSSLLTWQLGIDAPTSLEKAAGAHDLLFADACGDAHADIQAPEQHVLGVHLQMQQTSA